MATHDNAPPPPDWQPEARPWCTARVGSCGAVCETRQHCIWLGGDEVDEHLILGEN